MNSMNTTHNIDPKTEVRELIRDEVTAIRMTAI